jgi:ceramide glucosyltransferase
MPSFLHDLTLIETLIAVGLGASTFLYLLGLRSAHEFFSRRRNGVAPAAGDLPPVTVLKPLKGVDIELYENLVSLCRQRYHRFQILLGVADPADPAVLLARRLQQEYPDVDIELVVDSRVYGSNYKVSNLHNTVQRAKHDVIVLGDSDIRVGPDYLRRVVAPLSDPRVGLTTCLYRAVNRGGLPTLIESLFIHTDFDALVMVARKIEKSTYAFGATIALRREVLDEIGGFLPLANYLADDYQLGNRIAARGYELALSHEIVETVIGLGGWRRLFDHQLRWARTYRISRPGGYFGSILTHGTFWALLNVLYHHFSPLSCLISLAALSVRYFWAGAMTWRYLRADTSPLAMLLVAPKDLFVSLVWFLAFAGNTVAWSGRRFRVLRGGEMVDLSPAPPATGEPWPEPVRAAESLPRAAGQNR